MVRKTVDLLTIKAKEGVQLLNSINTSLSRTLWNPEEIATIQNKLLTSLTHQGYQLVTGCKGNCPNELCYDISYLGIDAIMELQETRAKFYSSKNALERGLRDQNHSVTVTAIDGKGADKNTKPPMAPAELEMLLHRYRAGIGILSGSSLSPKARRTVKMFLENKNYVDHIDLIGRLKKAYPSTRKLNTLEATLQYAIKDERTDFGRALRSQFPPGKRIQKSEIKRLVGNVLRLTYTQNAIALQDHLPKDDFAATKLFHRWIRHSHSKKDSASGEQYFTVRSYNPANFKITKYKED